MTVPELNLFGQFAGAWHTTITRFPADGSPPSTQIGDWEFSHALDGRAITDVWRVPADSVAVDDANREVGLCVRIWDPRLQLWRFTFHSTATSVVIHMYGQRVGDEIVLERAEGDSIERWVFHAIQPDAFSWRSEISTHGGPWRQIQTVQAQRASSASP
jgi:hypothetical protein